MDTEVKPKSMTIYIAKLNIVSINSKVFQQKDLALPLHPDGGTLCLLMQLTHPRHLRQHIRVRRQLLAHGLDFGTQGFCLRPLSLVGSDGEVFRALVLVVFQDGVPLGEYGAQHFVEHRHGYVPEGRVVFCAGGGDDRTVFFENIAVEDGVAVFSAAACLVVQLVFLGYSVAI